MRKCSVEGCERKYSWNGYCGKHAQRVRSHGKPHAYSPYDPNDIIYYEDGSAGIVLRNRWGRHVETAIVDQDMLTLLQKYKWHFKSDGYAATDIKINGEYTQKRMHNMITGFEKDVDHIDWNKLNNLRANLRKCTSQENKRNCPVRADNKSGVTGVCWRKDTKKWRSYIKFSNKKECLGNFENKEDAIIARIKAEIKHFGEFAPQVEKYKHLLEGI